MKKYIVFLLILGLFLVGTTSAKAVSMSDLQNEIKSLGEQITSLKSQLLGLVLSSRTATVEAPVPVVAPTATVLTKGVKSTEVAEVQTALKNQGYTITADGSFGAKTEEVVKTFQKTVGLPVTGKVDSLTRSKLVNPTPTVACDPNADGAPWIKVISPNGGETFTAGQQITITWQSCYSPSNSVLIGLSSSFNSSVNSKIITTNNDGQETIILPLSGGTGNQPLASGNYYKIGISLGGNPNLSDYSDNFFTINDSINLTSRCNPSAQPWVQILAPNGGETYQAGQKIRIKWRSCNIPANALGYINISIPSMNWGIGLNNSVINNGISEVTLPSNLTIPALPYGNIFEAQIIYTLFNTTFNGCLPGAIYSSTTGLPCNPPPTVGAFFDESDNLFTIN